MKWTDILYMYEATARYAVCGILNTFDFIAVALAKEERGGARSWH